MTESDVQQKIMQYIRSNFLYTGTSVELEGSTNLLAEGIIDSMGVVEIVTFLESDFGLSVGDDEITEENLGTVDGIARFVISKQAQVAA